MLDPLPSPQPTSALPPRCFANTSGTASVQKTEGLDQKDKWSRGKAAAFNHLFGGPSPTSESMECGHSETRLATPAHPLNMPPPAFLSPQPSSLIKSIPTPNLPGRARPVSMGSHQRGFRTYRPGVVPHLHMFCKLAGRWRLFRGQA